MIYLCEMRFYFNKKEYDLGETRMVSRFLLFPKRIGNEMRWLERAEIVKVMRNSYFFNAVGDKIDCCGWEDYAWVKDK